MIEEKKSEYVVQKIFLSTAEAMKAWGLSRYMLRKLVEDGTLIPVIPGEKNWKFHRDAYQDILDIKRDI